MKPNQGQPVVEQVIQRSAVELLTLTGLSVQEAESLAQVPPEVQLVDDDDDDAMSPDVGRFLEQSQSYGGAGQGSLPAGSVASVAGDQGSLPAPPPEESVNEEPEEGSDLRPVKHEPVEPAPAAGSDLRPVKQEQKSPMSPGQRRRTLLTVMQERGAKAEEKEAKTKRKPKVKTETKAKGKQLGCRLK